MPVKKSLYQVLGVTANASAEEIAAAGEAATARFADAGSPQSAGEKALVRDAIAILGDPVQRKAYDERLRNEHLRAMSSGSEVERPRSASSSTRVREPREAGTPSIDRSHLFAGLAVVLLTCTAGAWVYLDHNRKAAAQRLEEEKFAAQQKLRREESARRDESALQNRTRNEAAVKAAIERQVAIDQERSRRQYAYEQQSQAQQAANEERRKIAEQRNAESQRQREEQENVRRSQMQLEREKRYLRELEGNRPHKF